jgi:hypothetical protein
MQIGGGFQVSSCSLSHTGAMSHQHFDKFNWARKALLQDDELKEKPGKIVAIVMHPASMDVHIP